MMVEGELCILLWQPAVGPWEALRVYPKEGQHEVEATDVLLAVQVTGCFVEATELEQQVQIQLQEFEPPGIKVWTADVGDRADLQPTGGSGPPSPAFWTKRTPATRQRSRHG